MTEEALSKKALRRTLFNYKLHQDGELFEKAYGYVKQYYSTQLMALRGK
jgi:hypothetical protein